MSIADIVSSMAMAAGTLAMPKDMIYDFDGMVLGNSFTCSLQGFMIFFGAFAAIAYNACLSIYFMCLISLKMNYRVMRRCLEPCMHAVCMLSTLPTALLFVFYKSYNPTPFEPWCIAISYPYYCKTEDDLSGTCRIRGRSPSSGKTLLRYYVFFFSLGPIITIFCMVIIARTVYVQQKYILSYVRLLGTRHAPLVRMNLSTPRAERARMLEMTKQRHAYTKIMMMQCAGYIIANIIPVGSGFAAAGMQGQLKESNTGLILRVIFTLFRPSQGLLNFIVFFFQKCHDRRRLDPGLTLCQAAKRVLFEREEEDFQLSNLSLVRVHQFSNDNNRLSAYEFDGEEDYSNAGGNEINSADLDEIESEDLDEIESEPIPEGSGVVEDDDFLETTSSEMKTSDVVDDGIDSYDTRIWSLDDNNIDRFSICSNSNSRMSSRVSWNPGPQQCEGSLPE